MAEVTQNDEQTQAEVFAAFNEELRQGIESLKVFRNVISNDTGAFVENFFGVLTKGVLSALEAQEFKLVDTSLMARRELMQEVEKRAKPTMQIAEMLERATGFNAQTLKDFSSASDSTIANLRDNTYKTMNDLARERVKFIDGSEADLAQLHLDLTEVVETYNTAYINDVRLARFAVNAMNSDFATQSQLAVDNLKLSTQNLNFIAALELSKTGKISKDSLVDFEKAVIATTELSGVAPVKVAKDLLKIQENFTAFGDISLPKAGALIDTMSRLGLAVEDVTRLTGNFQSFDRAAQAMSNLAASTGATLDTLELFQLANTDQEAFIISLREQLESQGIEFDKMNVLQQKQVAQALGIDPRGLQRILNDNLSAIGDTRYQLEDKMAGLSEEEADKFVNSMTSIKDASLNTSEAIAQAKAAAIEASSGLASEMEKFYKNMLVTISEATKIVGGERESQRKFVDQLRETLADLNERDAKAVVRGAEEARRVTAEPRQREPETPAAAPEIPLFAAPERRALPETASPIPFAANSATSPQSSTSSTAASNRSAPEPPSPQPAVPSSAPTTIRHEIVLTFAGSDDLTRQLANTIGNIHLTEGINTGDRTITLTVNEDGR